MLIHLALKNVLKYKRRTLLTFLIMSYGIALYLFASGLLAGIDKDSFENIIHFDTGHFRIRTFEYDETAPLSEENFIKNSGSIKDRLKEYDFITGYTERIKMTGELDNGIDSLFVNVIGIDKNSDAEVFNLFKFVDGEFSGDGILIGRSLAKEFDLDIGDLIYFTFRTATGMIDSMEFEVSGYVNAPDPVSSTSTIFIDLETLKGMLNTEGITEITLMTDDTDKYALYQETLKKIIPEYEVLSYIQLADTMISLTKTKKAAQSILILFILIIAVIGIVNTMIMSVLEKKKEIGTLKALGMKNSDINRLFIFEGAMIGFLGAIFGMILGFFANLYFVKNGMDITAMIGSEDIDIGYRVMGVIYSRFEINSFVFSFILCLIASILASYFPARNAAKLSAVDCLRDK